MIAMKSLLAVSGLAAILTFQINPATASSTKYPLTIENCGAKITFEKAPERSIGLGQNSAEILLLLGLEDKMAGTAFWPSKVLPQLEAANSKVKLLTVEFPTFESILAENPDFVAASLPSLIGKSSKVAKREDFDKVGVPTYLSPSTCLSTEQVKDEYGSRDELWNMNLLYKEIDELSQIFDVTDRGQRLIADFKAREAALRASVPTGGKKLSYVFWFSSQSPSADAYLGGGNGASSFIANVLGGENAIKAEAEWPTLGWESIIAANPDVIVVANLDRNRWELDKPEAKIAFLNSDPAVSQMPAVKNKAIAVMDGQAMNPTIRTIYGAEQVAEQLKVLGILK
ncbi:ABC transporter substrate-binding protein [Ochrobactrum sp. MYb15]|uniref:ABC transporter substrate-binding protein n=1 Tax=Brucella TaxID=234 RepID=UPI0004662D85|nr:ABC transporter substrate-binding protein [Brucella rhizosphaerae]PQZ48465.1 ABC transporter substrate-binding protein [Ochrobactrum sp. MYb19]PRA51588.1 ABC transporter substrate-binding protein [Ochrobactrum sp. MYb68]PRA64649.1 ABC transporter substrate-binding protein [Ochrobactrum sp. MYb18]PRA74840.1 ABC transporter substrate-binding protein [Brucella thiophenivorans]PRA89949.1 ABC transporter substrate-binding protein [Ochrobactrum sp. MYb14]PRA96982.1 ABC transporter substrate-bind